MSPDVYGLGPINIKHTCLTRHYTINVGRPFVIRTRSYQLTTSHHPRGWCAPVRGFILGRLGHLRVLIKNCLFFCRWRLTHGSAVFVFVPPCAFGHPTHAWDLATNKPDCAGVPSGIVADVRGFKFYSGFNWCPPARTRHSDAGLLLIRNLERPQTSRSNSALGRSCFSFASFNSRPPKPQND